MNKRNIFIADKLYASDGKTVVKNLSFKLSDNCINIISTEHTDIVKSLILGDILPDKGNILLSGVNIGNHSRCERRIEEILPLQNLGKTEKLIKAALNIDTSRPTYYELQKKAKTAELLKVKSQQKQNAHDDSLKAKQKQLQLDITAIELKEKHRKTDFEVNLKATNALLNSVTKNRLTERTQEYTEKLTAKLFSLNYEYANFNHKKLSDSEVALRTKAVLKQFDLPKEIKEDTLFSRLVLAYSKAPVLMIYCGSIDSELWDCFNDFIKKTGVTIAVITNSPYSVVSDNTISIPNDLFKNA